MASVSVAKVCALPWCRQTGSHLTFQTFPDNEIRQMQWLTLLDVADTWKDVPPEKLQNYIICNLHFDTRGTLLRAISTPLVTTAHTKQTTTEDALPRQLQLHLQQLVSGPKPLTTTTISPITSGSVSTEVRSGNRMVTRKSRSMIPQVIVKKNEPRFAKRETFANSNAIVPEIKKVKSAVSKNNCRTLSPLAAAGNIASSKVRMQMLATSSKTSTSTGTNHHQETIATVKAKRKGTTTSGSETNSDLDSEDDDGNNRLGLPVSSQVRMQMPSEISVIQNSNNYNEVDQGDYFTESANSSTYYSKPKIVSCHSLAKSSNNSVFSSPSPKLVYATQGQVPESARWTRESFSLGKKIEIVRHLESGMKQADVCRIFRLPKSTVWSIWKNREKIESAFLCSSPSRKKLRKSRFQEVDSALFKWYNNVSCQNVAVTTRLLQTMAETFAQDLGQTEFVCTAGWLERFKQRYCISLKLQKKIRKLESSVETLHADEAHCEGAARFVVKNQTLNTYTREKHEIGTSVNNYDDNVIVDKHDGNCDSYNGNDIDHDIDQTIVKYEDHEDNNNGSHDIQNSSKEVTFESLGLTLTPETSLSLPSALANDWINHTWPKSRMFKKSKTYLKQKSKSVMQKQNELNDPDQNADQNQGQSYSPSNIFAAEETGILYRLTPETAFRMLKSRSNSSLSTESQKQKMAEYDEFSISKERITVMLCANSDGSEKKRLCVFSQIRSPPCIASIMGEGNDFSSLPVDYRPTSDLTSWINEESFEYWLKEWDMNLRETENNRKILLTLSSSPIHCAIPKLTNIEIVLIPNQVTNFLQPMQQGIIREFKFRYRRLQLERLVYYLEQGKEAEITLLDSILMLSTAWCEISKGAISTSFATAGIVAENYVFSYKHYFPRPYRFNGFDTVALIGKAVSVGLSIPSGWEFQDFVDVDDCLFAVDYQPDQYEGQNEIPELTTGAKTGTDNDAISITYTGCNNGTRDQNECTVFGMGNYQNLNQEMNSLTPSEIQIYLDVIKMWAMSKEGPSSCPQKVHDALSTLQSFANDHT